MCAGQMFLCLHQETGLLRRQRSNRIRPKLVKGGEKWVKEG